MAMSTPQTVNSSVGSKESLDGIEILLEWKWDVRFKALAIALSSPSFALPTLSVCLPTIKSPFPNPSTLSFGHDDGDGGGDNGR